MDSASSTPHAPPAADHVPSNLPTSDHMPPGITLPTAPPGAPRMEFQKKNSSYGALISIIIILAVIVVGAFYSWGKRIEQNSKVIELPAETIDDTASTTSAH